MSGPPEKLPVYSWEEVKKHTTSESLWLVINNNVYDVTKFIEDVSWKFLQ